jgi:long-chain acyl-CoA synthetase
MPDPSVTTHADDAILERIAERAAERPQAIAMREVSGARVQRDITREALVQRARAMAQGLAAYGFARGDRVVFSVRPGIDAVCLVLAVHALGGVLVPQDPGTADALVAARMALLRPRWVVAESVLLARAGGLVARLLQHRGVRLAPLGDLANVRFVRVGPWLPGLPRALPLRALLTVESRPDRASTGGDAPLSPDAEAFIVCTSGTTSAPKAVVHTRASLGSILRTVTGELAPTAQDVVYARDLHLLLPALCTGALAVVPRELTMRAERTLQALSHCGATHAFFTTRDCRLLVEQCESAGTTLPTSLRSLMIGAAPVRSPFLARLAPLLPRSCVAWCVYGATEMLPIARVDLEEKLAYTGDGDLIGRPVPGVTVRLDAHGQLYVRGPSLCAGYAGQPAMEEHATGDLARQDGDRFVLLGRLKDMIIRGDHNIYPELYEPLVERIPGVRRAAMLGDFQEADADERVVLVVEAEAGESSALLHQRVWDAVRSGPHRLDRTALPDEIRVAELPEAGRSHKLDKRALRQALGLRAPGE